MTKAEERRALLQAQSATQPQQKPIQQEQGLTKAEQRRLQLQQPTPLPLSTGTPQAQNLPNANLEPQVVQYANHGATQHQALAQKQANIATNVTKPMTSYLQNGGSININDTASLAQLARERGVSEDRINQATAQTNQPMQLQYPEYAEEITPLKQLGNAATDTLSTIGHGAVVGTAKVLNAAKMAADYLSTNDTALVNADKLLEYSNKNRFSKDPMELRSYNFFKNIVENRPDDYRLQELFNQINEGTFKGTAEDLRQALDKAQERYQQGLYNKWVKPSEEAKDKYLEEIEPRHSTGGMNLLRGEEALSEGLSPVLLSGGLGASAPVSMALGGSVQGENKMQQYLESGKSFQEARKEVPIETAKGLVYGTVLQAATPFMAAGTTPNPSTLSEVLKNMVMQFRNGAIMGGVANTGTQLLDLLKDDPNYDYINWDKVKQGVEEGKYKDLDDYLNSSEFTKDVISSRATQLGIASAITGGFNVLSQAPNTIRAIKNALNNKYDAAADLKLLGLEKNATLDDVNKAYRQWAKVNRPDLGNVTGTQNEDIRNAVERLRAYYNKTTPTFIENLKKWFSANKGAVNTQGAVATDQALVPYAGNTVANVVQPAQVVTNQVAQPIQTAQPMAETPSQTQLTTTDDIDKFAEQQTAYDDWQRALEKATRTGTYEDYIASIEAEKRLDKANMPQQKTVKATESNENTIKNLENSNQSSFSMPENSHKAQQLKIIQDTNPAPEGTNYVWVRKLDDIKTFQEAIEDSESFTWGDYSKEDALKDLNRNKVRIYSSYPIKNGVFVSTSYQQALDYAGGDASKVHSREVSPSRVAWINGDEGQYASVKKVENTGNLQNPKRVSLGQWDSASNYWENNKERLMRESIINDNDGIIIKSKKGNLYIELENGEIKNISDSIPKVVAINNPKQPINDELQQTSSKVLKDNKGRTLTNQEKSLYKDQAKQGLDENGNLLTFYHGTPDSSFNEFKDGTYWTTNKGYADRYQSTNASSLGNSGKNVNNPKTYEAHIEIKHPFDLGDPEAKRIFINEYIKGGNALSINPYESDEYYNGINVIDWTEGEDLREWLQENYPDKYDSIILDEGSDGGYGEEVVDRGDSFLIFKNKQIHPIEETPKSTYDSAMLPTKEELQQFENNRKQAEIDAIRKGAKALGLEKESAPPAKPPEPPSDNRKVRKHIKTIANTESIPREVAQDIRKDERKYYVPQSNEETINNAKAIIGDDYARAERAFLEKPTLEYAEDTAIADLLIQKAIETGDYQKADELAINLSQKYTSIAQTLQAARIIKNLSPSGMLVYAEKELDKATQTIRKESPKLFEKLKEQGVITKTKTGAERIQLTDEEKKAIVDNMEKASKLPEGREKDVLVAETLKTVGNKIPATALEKVASLRRNGLLANFKTLNRNLGSNIAFGLLENVKDIPGTLIDSITSLVTGNRTTTLPNIGAGAKGWVKGGINAIQDLYYGIDTTDGSGGKYELPSKAFKRENTYKEIARTLGKGNIKEGSKMLFKRMLSDYEDIAGFFVNGTDRPFYNARFESELANQMKLGGLKYGEDAPTDEMMKTAEEAANYATFKNPNALSKSLSGLRQTLNRGKPIGAADALGLTFTNVPGSVGTKILDYTAGGYAKAIKQLYNAATHNGQFDQKKFVDYLARAVTGTGLVTLLIPLIKNKILRGSYDSDKDKADIEREMGIQQNSINVSALKRYVKGEDPSLKEGDKFYNFDWLQPISGFAILGSNVYNTIHKGEDNGDEGVVGNLDDENEYYVKRSNNVNIGDVATETAKTIGNQVADMSSLGNFSDLFKGYEGIGGNLVDIPGNFASSFIPTISNNTAQYTDKIARNTKDYTSKWKTNINKIINKLPGARETLEPKVNTMGEEKQQYVDGNDFVSTFLNPGYMTTYNPTDIQKELEAVYEETGDKTIYPSVVNGTITSKGETVTLKPKGVTEAQKASGNYASGIYDALLDSEFYKSLEADQKATVLKKIADDSRDVGKAAIGIQTDNYFKLDTNREIMEKNGIPLVDYYLLYKASTGSGKKTGFAQTVDLINEKQGKDYISKDDKAVLRDIFGIK